MAKLIMHIMACIFLLELINCESVQVKFMDYTSKEWTSLYEHNVKQAVASQLADYCSQSDCAVTKKDENITEKNVEFEGLHGETHTIDGRFIIVKVSASVEGQELTAAVLNDFLVARRQNIVDEGKVAIAFINDVFVYPPRDQTDNYIIVTAISAVTIGLFVVNMILSNKK